MFTRVTFFCTISLRRVDQTQLFYSGFVNLSNMSTEKVNGIYLFRDKE